MATIDSLHGIKVGTTLDYEGQPYIVVSANFMRCQMRKPVMQTKMKNLINGKVLEVNFKPGDKLEEANLGRSSANYLYCSDSECYLMDNESYEQISLPRESLGDKANFLLEGQEVSVMKYNDIAVAVDIPKKVNLKVTEAPPGIKGDTAQGGSKQITLETGYKVNAPLFIKEGEIVVINTDNGEYVGRA